MVAAHSVAAQLLGEKGEVVSNDTKSALKTLQVAVSDFYFRKGYYTVSAQTLALGVTEETGELAEAILVLCTNDFIMSERKRVKWIQDGLCLSYRPIAHELVDIITYCLAIANKLDIELNLNLD